MSYCRWSTIINSGLTWEEEFKLITNEISMQDRLKHCKEGAEISQWYIFHHADSGEWLEQQYLAIWHVEGDGHPTLPYDVVKAMYESDDWYALDVVTQQEFLRKCVKQWLDDVEAEYHSAADELVEQSQELGLYD
jgi:hypothetical protein